MKRKRKKNIKRKERRRIEKNIIKRRTDFILRIRVKFSVKNKYLIYLFLSHLHPIIPLLFLDIIKILKSKTGLFILYQ